MSDPHFASGNQNQEVGHSGGRPETYLDNDQSQSSKSQGFVDGVMSSVGMGNGDDSKTNNNNNNNNNNNSNQGAQRASEDSSNPSLGDMPGRVSHKIRDHIAPNAAVVDANKKPGLSKKDRPAGTAFPIAGVANQNAVDPKKAHHQQNSVPNKVDDTHINSQERTAEQKAGAIAVPDNKLPGNAAYQKNYTPMDRKATADEFDLIQGGPGVPGLSSRIEAEGEDKGKVSDSIDGAYIEKMAAKNMEKNQIPEPKKLGWKQMGGWSEEMGITSDEQADDLITKSTLLEEYIANKFYGDWYHNIACIVVTGVLSFLVAKLGGGTAWLILVLAVTGTYYRTSIRRLRRNVRDDITREAAVKRIESEEETMEWLNLFMVKFWVIYEPVLAATVVQIGNQVLAGSTPGFIESMAIESFTLGTKPPRVDHVRTFPKTEDDVSIMDWKFSFTPNDTEDLTARQLKNKVNPKVVLSVRIGKGVVSKSLPILLEDMSFSGHVRIRIRMMTLFPHIQTVDISFLEPPDFDFVLKPIGGETLGFDINVIPGLTSFIHEMVHANIGPMMYAPNAFQLNVQQMLSGSALDSAVGVLAITVYRAGNLKGSGRIGNTVDPYIIFWLKNEECGRTSVKKDTCNPRWNETKYLLVNNLTEVLRMEIIDFNDFRTDKTIGSVSMNLDTVSAKPEQKGIHGEVLEGRKKKGTLIYDARWFPVLEGKTLEDGTTEPPPDSPSGILRVVINQCKDLDPKLSMVGQLSPYVELAFNGKLLHNTNVIKRSNNPVWDDAFEFLVTDKDSGKVSFTVKDSRGMSSDPVIGKIQKTVDDLVESTEDGEDWHDFADAGRMRITALWKPLGLSGVGGGSGYVEPIGVLRFHIIKATDLRNLETVGKVDPYVRILVGGYARCRTRTITANLDPVWDEYIYAPVHSSHERITVECMDSEKVSHDRSLGKFEHRASSIIKTDDDGNYVPYVDEKGHVGELQLGKKSPKGRVEFYCSFYPCLPVMSPAEQKKKAEIDEKKAAQAKEKGVAASVKSGASKQEGGGGWWGGGAAKEDPQADLKAASNDNDDTAKGSDSGAIDSTGLDGSEGDSTLKADTPKAMTPEEQKAKIKADTKAKAAAAKDKTKAAKAADKAGAQSDNVNPKSKGVDEDTTEEADHPVGGVDESSGGDAFEGKLDWPFDKIVSHDTGLLPFTMKSYKVIGEKECYLQVLFDEFAIPKWSSGKIKENNPECNETSDAMIRELYKSKITVRLTSRKSIETDEERKEHLLGSHTMNTFDFLKSSYGKDYTMAFDTKRGHCECVMSAWYLPLEFSIDPCESLDNMGYLKVSVLDAHDLPAADRSGKSDPYAVFDLEGKRVFKTKTQKKTLDPVWNEFFEMAISSLIKADFTVNVWDWDMGPADDDFLGKARVDLSDINPHEEAVKVLDLFGEDGEHAGSIRLAFNFSPEYIPKTWQGKSMMSGAVGTPGKIITSVAGAPIKGIGFVGHGVHRGASKLKRAIFGRHKDKGDEDSEGEMREDPNDGETHGSEHDLNESEPGVSHFGGPSSARNPHAADTDTGATSGHPHLGGAMDGAHNAASAVGGAVGGAGHAVGGAFSGLKDKVAGHRAANASYDDDPNVDVDAVNEGQDQPRRSGLGARMKGMMASNHEDDPTSASPVDSADGQQGGHHSHNPFGRIERDFDKVGSKINPFNRGGNDKGNDGDHNLKAPAMPDARKSMERKSMDSHLSPSDTRGSIMSSRTGRTGRTGHSRANSTASNHGAAALFQGETFPGTLTILRARGFQGTDRLQVKVYLSGRKDRELWKKRIKPTEREDYDINQEVPFKAEPTAKLVISCKEDRTFGRSEHFGRWSVNVAEIKNGEQEIEFGENGFMKINLHFEQPDLSERLS
ncbi:Conserved hypothetical protein [Yarrowia lipolytica]|nr:Conserved hypothetical protein [Yarrowia lipolytica]